MLVSAGATGILPVGELGVDGVEGYDAASFHLHPHVWIRRLHLRGAPETASSSPATGAGTGSRPGLIAPWVICPTGPAGG